MLFPRHWRNNLFVLICLFSVISPSFANLERAQRPSHLGLSFGTPAPSYIGLSLGVQYNSMLQLIFSGGYAWPGELNITTLAMQARVQMFPTNLTPILGGGLSFFFLGGEGSFEQLKSSTMLGSMHVGLDWSASSFMRLTAGYHFHFPIALNYPFFEINIMFE